MQKSRTWKKELLRVYLYIATFRFPDSTFCTLLRNTVSPFLSIRRHTSTERLPRDVRRIREVFRGEPGLFKEILKPCPPRSQKRICCTYFRAGPGVTKGGTYDGVCQPAFRGVTTTERTTSTRSKTTTRMRQERCSWLVPSLVKGGTAPPTMPAFNRLAWTLIRPLARPPSPAGRRESFTAPAA
jgi:hypothetical protein